MVELVEQIKKVLRFHLLQDDIENLNLIEQSLNRKIFIKEINEEKN